MNQPRTEIEPCPICQQQTYTPFFELRNVPAQDGVLWNSKEEAVSPPTGDIKLAFCHECGYIGNLLYQPQKVRYDQDYSFSLHYSPTYQAFIYDLADRLVKSYGVREQTILEIGCGQGDFLRLICQLGKNHGIGIDPSITPHVEENDGRQITFLQDLYTEKYTTLAAEVICCRQVLDQVMNPKAFVELVRRNIGERATTVYFEVPNATNIFKDLLVRNVIYEKSSWFAPSSLARLLELSGFKLLSVKPCFEEGQYLAIEAVPTDDSPPEQTAPNPEVAALAQSIAAFAEKYKQMMQNWRGRVDTIARSGQRAIAWGAGSGAISFLSMLKIGEEIPYVVDINPKRQGKFLPLTGQQVVPPTFLTAYRPELVIITNATYSTEIKQQVHELGIQCEFMTV